MSNSSDDDIPLKQRVAKKKPASKKPVLPGGVGSADGDFAARVFAAVLRAERQGGLQGGGGGAAEGVHERAGPRGHQRSSEDVECQQWKQLAVEDPCRAEVN
ncbi:hypothetical protein ENH_00013470 [Eimeria necatrix]|uniref:Uncharacterized protein n=1 Tax=Eimeria necatrix TaxID=51315 RepID=U6MSK0_9EIME|nr:hypothetical protein ENH_00013470 [Eimeria necatrix]CDJ66043.1 hypothetical protein ENH_00013470 [Eimeria necatrix]